ncbi:MAG: hypothetical protein KatS3mg096_232 [Candidatus Parcubacteria bacterium]|nr:MAG: hypothetical protein KatS3mg096_232 [Candidatus Parcubacteria bacterium]
MTIFDLTIGRILSLVEGINRFLFQTPVEILKAFGFFFSIIITGLMIFYWLKIEKETKDETNYWKTLIKNLKDFEFLKNPKKNFEEIKKIFYQDKNKALIEINNFFDFVLTVFGYTDKLEEKLNKVSIEFLPNLEEIKKAYKIVTIIEEKLKNNEEINLTEDEYLTIFHEYEKALYNLNILTIEDFLVRNQG